VVVERKDEEGKESMSTLQDASWEPFKGETGRSPKAGKKSPWEEIRKGGREARSVQMAKGGGMFRKVKEEAAKRGVIGSLVSHWVSSEGDSILMRKADGGHCDGGRGPLVNFEGGGSSSPKKKNKKGCQQELSGRTKGAGVILLLVYKNRRRWGCTQQKTKSWGEGPKRQGRGGKGDAGCNGFEVGG